VNLDGSDGLGVRRGSKCKSEDGRDRDDNRLLHGGTIAQSARRRCSFVHVDEREQELVERASGGDRRAFDLLVTPHLGKLRSYLLRLVAHAQDAEDLVQETTLLAFTRLATFRGESAFTTWLFTIATRLALTHLRTRKRRWPATIQLEMHDRAQQDTAFLGELGGELARPDFRYEVGEHVAYCFSCVGRSLDPEESAAVLLREVFELPNHEAAKVLELSESTFRHRLAAGRRTMETAFDGLCALVGKQGACHQCATLRELSPPERRGPDVPALASYDDRLALVRAADAATGTTARIHAAMLRFIARHGDG